MFLFRALFYCLRSALAIFLIIVELCLAGPHELSENAQGIANSSSIEHAQNGILKQMTPIGSFQCPE